ncbi:MAG: dTDP-4-dehydrorhamnose 3,5-epimerase [Candidatus Omnitrophota bacterium]|nr:dTDP-4-dehydrorhamnose 3,5-epimerase [Candidatus Omnitrophota bacterium]
MNFIPLAIPDVILIEPKIYGDSRGYFYEAYREDEFKKNGILARFIQDNQSRSARGVLRGLHFQTAPKAQGKLIRVIRGEIFDVAVDIRRGSKTYGDFVTENLSGDNKKMLYVPEGFAHGFCTLEDDTEVFYKCTDVYSREHERGVRWNDPALAIPWPKLNGEYTLSPKDQKYPSLKDLSSALSF